MSLSVYTNTKVWFFDQSSADITSWLWNFGDGTTATTKNASHVYSVAGTYTVSLTVESDQGSVTAYDTVVVGTSFVDFSQPEITAWFPGTNPQVMLRWSNDGGRTWGPEHWRNAGKQGEYGKRVRWNRQGVGRRRVYEVVLTDPIQWRIVGAYLNAIQVDKDAKPV